MKFLSGKARKGMCVTLAGILAAGMLTGCGGKGSGGSGDELTYWSPLHANVTQVANNMGDTPFGKALQEQTGVSVKWIHPAQGQNSEKFNLLLASGDLPDIVEYYWGDYTGGPDKAIEQGLIIDLNEYRDKLPNFFKVLDENEEIKKLVSTDTGKIFAFPMIRLDESLNTSGGIIIRQDWLDELGLESPETMDEWENVLTQFKEKKGATAPLSFNYAFFKQGIFAGAYDTSYSYYHDGDTVKYGPYEPAYKEFVEKMRTWYEKGLLDKNFATLDQTTSDSNILNGISGATFGGIGGGIGKLMQSKTSDSFLLSGAKFPTLNKGDKSEFGFTTLSVPSAPCAAISAKSEHIDEALKLMDYGYSEEGHMLYNFGIEGESYEMVDDYPTYTENITNNADGTSMSVMMAQYLRAYDGGPFVQDVGYMEQYASMDVQKQAWSTWADTNAKNHIMPNIYVTEDEAEEFAQLNTSISTYVDEMIVKFITGQESMDNYDSFLAELENRGIKRAIEIKQNAYDRFLER